MMCKYINLVMALFLFSSIGKGSRWNRTGDLNTNRSGFGTAVLTDGRVMIVGGSFSKFTYDIFDFADGSWVLGTLPGGITNHAVAMLLQNGKTMYIDTLGAIWLYDYSGNWTLSAASFGPHTWGLADDMCPATLLKNGNMLTINYKLPFTGECAIYYYEGDSIGPTGSMGGGNYSIMGGRAVEVLLPDARVLLSRSNRWGGCELYNPSSGTWSLTDSMKKDRSHTHCGVLLRYPRKVLVAGGWNVPQCELYDLSSGTWQYTDDLNYSSRDVAAMAVLPSGKVLMAGGSWSNTSEIYDPISEIWTYTDTMTIGRCHYSLAILPTGKVLAAGNFGPTPKDRKTEIYDPTEPDWTDKLPLYQERGAHTVTPLPIIHTSNCSTNVLIAGGENSSGALRICELYNYLTESVVITDSLKIARAYHTAVLLASSKILAVGGKNSTGPLNSCELYDANTESWTFTDSLSTARFDHTATLLKDGKVLVTGGENSSSYLSTYEVYDGTSWSSTGSMATARTHHTAVVLLDGRVLVIGGENLSGVLSSCELWNGTTWSATGSLTTGRCLHAAVLLQSGKVLVIGGKGSIGNALTSCEIYNPSTGSWSAGSNLTTARYAHNSTLLYSGLVFVTGGQNASGYLSTCEIWDPATAQYEGWKTTAPLGDARAYHSSVIIPDLQPYILAIGGRNSSAFIKSVEEYDIGLKYRSEWQSTITNYPSVTLISNPMHIEGTLFRDITEADGGNHCHIVSNDHPIISLLRVGGGNWQGNGGGDILYIPPSSSWNEIHTDVHPPTDFAQGYYRLWSIVNGIPCKWYKECPPTGAEESEWQGFRLATQVFPNPSSARTGVYFHFKLPTLNSLNSQPLALKIYDSSGRLIRESNIQYTEYGTGIKLHGLTPGIYFYRVIYNGSESKGKFIIIK